MPVQYNPIVPWNARGADKAGAYGKGFGLGLQAGQAQAQINMERARLAEAQNRTQVEIALRQQELQRKSMVDQQRLQVESAYKQQQGELKAQELAMKEQMFQEKVKEAAQRTMAMDRFRTAIANNEDPLRASLGLAGVAGTGPLTSKALGLLHEKLNPQIHEPQIKQLPDGSLIAWNPGNKNFGVTRIPSDKGNQIPLKDLYDQSLKTLQELGMHIDSKGKKDEMYPILEKSLNELQEMIASRKKGGSEPSQDLPIDWKVLPWPKTENDLQKGRLYNTPAKGIMYYDKGGKWTRPMSPALHQNELSMTDEDQPDTEVSDVEDIPEEETEMA